MANRRLPDVRRHLPSTAFVLVLLLGLAILAAIFIYTGVYNIGADAPHWRPVYSVLETLRERAIAHHARNIAIPADLDSPGRVSAGAGLYGEMCSGCHLAPGMEKTEISQGLYPPAPELARGSSKSASQQFWIIKHGVKLSAMPAWGRTHDDRLIWDMVAFVRKLPSLSPAQYQAAVKNAPEDHDEMMKDMPGMGHDGAGHAH